MREKYTVLKEILQISNLETLADRRDNVITKFSIKKYNNPKFKTWFVKKDNKNVNTRSTKQFLKKAASWTG